MIEAGVIFSVCLISALVGIAFSEIVLEGNRKKARETRIVHVEEEPAEEDLPPDPMSLRNGYGVTRDPYPTFAEQWVNIMNFNGESQLEGDYDEGEGTDR